MSTNSFISPSADVYFKEIVGFMDKISIFLIIKH